MRIHLEQLPHQEKAIAKILQAMEGCVDTSSNNPDANYIYANPVLKRIGGIDVKMETGTGKTYVYTRLMHELYRAHGINKFIIMTPSLPIKEGTRSFISSEYSRQHFRELFANQKINLGVVNAGDFNTKKGKRKQFASALSEFCDASINDIGGVNALLLNDAMLASKSMTRDDYDQTLIGSSSCPVEALKLTRPIVIIDEPHRFKKDGTAWKNIENLNPQLIIRFGATFPDKAFGKGRSKIVKKDYDNLVYDLNAVDSFNDGLVKAIDINYPNLPEDQASVRYRVESATNKELVLGKDGKHWTVRAGEDLSMVDPQFDGDTTYEGKKLSNELEVGVGTSLIPGVWTNSYQELILRQAIDAHFDKEKDLFDRPANAPRVKTLSLFFIDSIASYRNPDGWLKVTFEKLLAEKLDQLIAKESGEYKEFLQATKASLASDDQKVHAGYFAEDTGKKGDEALQAEVDDILRGKEKLLQFRDEKGSWNTRRFLFSKWTLREGWDNPNVFVLTKLRSSGSDNSKIQEVGRGLRLPVDELGNRLSNEEFRLHFLVDYSERDFASQLIGEINADGGIVKITDEVLAKLVSSGYAESTSKAKGMLLLDDIINDHDEIIDIDKFEKLMPAGVQKGKVRENLGKKPTVRLRKNNWKIIESMWAETSKRFMLKYSSLSKNEIQNLADRVFSGNDIFSKSRGEVVQLSTVYDEESKTIKLVQSTATIDQSFGQMKYGDFLRYAGKATNLPINTLHGCVSKQFSGLSKSEVADRLNQNSLRNIIEKFKVEFVRSFYEAHEYDALDFTASVSVFDSAGNLKSDLDQGVVGTQKADDIAVPDNYLYDEPVFDSQIEHEILQQTVPNGVLVFGKLPRRSIKVPTFTGGTTSPDFVYAIRDGVSDKVKIHALIEAKGKEEVALSDLEKVALQAQSKISKKLNNVDIRLVTNASEVTNILQQII